MKDPLDLYEECIEEINQEIRSFIDPEFPSIKFGAKFTPWNRGNEYSVYTVTDPRPNENGEIEVSEIIYSSVGSGFARITKQPITTYIKRIDLLRTHRPAGQRRNKI